MHSRFTVEEGVFDAVFILLQVVKISNHICLQRNGIILCRVIGGFFEKSDETILFITVILLCYPLTF